MFGGKTLGWGLIGASNIAREYMIAAINTQPDSRVVAVMSSHYERARSFAEENGISRAYDTLDGVLSDPDVDIVYISTTNERHREATLAASLAGKHVLCEKPLALNLREALEMVEACRVAGVVMGTNHHLRNAATHRAIRQLISEGAIGRVLAARVFHAAYLPPFLQTWRVKEAAKGGGAIVDITVHDSDTLRFALADEVEEVTAMAAQQGLAMGDLEDGVMGVMRFSGGTLVQFHDAFTIPHASTGIEFHGTEGSIFGEDVMTQAPTGRVFLRRGTERSEVDVGPQENLYVRAVRLFSQAVRGGGAPAATGEDGVRSLAIALAVLESSRTGRRVAVRYQ